MDDARHAAARARLDREHGRPPRCVTKSSCRCSRMPLLRTSCSSSVGDALAAGREARRGASVASARRCPSGRSRPARPRGRSPLRAASAWVDAAASSRSSGASCSSSAARARSEPATVSPTCRSAEAARTPPSAACAAVSRTSRIPSSGGSAASSSSATASAVSAWRRATSSRVRRGRERAASSAPRSVAAAWRDPLAGSQGTRVLRVRKDPRPECRTTIAAWLLSKSASSRTASARSCWRLAHRRYDGDALVFYKQWLGGAGVQPRSGADPSDGAAFRGSGPGRGLRASSALRDVLIGVRSMHVGARRCHRSGSSCRHHWKEALKASADGASRTWLLAPLDPRHADRRCFHLAS